MAREKLSAPDVVPAYSALIALVAGARADMDVDQVTAEIVSCPWSKTLVLEAARAIWEEPLPRLNIASNVVPVASHRVPVTDVQKAAYADHARKLMARSRGDRP
ncbi:hypothetical protein GCM10022252_75290 [Streptosporangium oxazolinicum]|uniref:Uncharacterized protein n=1 Tax=Streptosporangium oxazolinicum TaxID=909287 RepID=A0ABP8BKH4_9ACTN